MVKLVVQSSLWSWLHILLTWLLSHLNFWHSDSGRVNAKDTWKCNTYIKNRAWRIPELCNYMYAKYGKLVELRLLGQRVLIITDMKIAHSLMTNHGNHLKQRFGNQFGLQKLNMYMTGLIWNNNVQQWKKNRNIFESTLKSGTKSLTALALSHFETIEKTTLKIAEPVTVLELLRDFTLTMTMKGLFGISMLDTFAWREEAKTTVANYFKAWEFYLLNPNSDSLAENESHQNACSKMIDFSQEIFAESDKIKCSNFISSLSHCNNETLQCIAEMLLAGTDTSSLTMFYTMLFLADFPDIANQLSRVIQSETQHTVDKEISYVYYESMRLIPVGPVILRQCETDINDENVSLKKGDGIIFNIAGMNRVDYDQHEIFNPSRYRDGTDSFPLSFGSGKKSCVGKTFAEKEMKIFFTWFLSKYIVLGHREGMVGLLKTRWDVANAPVNDIKLTIFPRNRFFFVGENKMVKQMFNRTKAAYPKIKIIYSEDRLMNHSNKFRDLQLELIKAQLELVKTFEYEFVLIEDVIVESLIRLNRNGLTYDYDEKELFGPIENSLVVYFPYSEQHNEEYLNILERMGYRHHCLKSTTETGRYTEIMNFIGNSPNFLLGPS